jgi:hypothetical protein
MIDFKAISAEIHDALNGRIYAPELLNSILFYNQTDCPCVIQIKEAIWDKLDKCFSLKTGPISNTDIYVCKALLSVPHNYCHQCASIGS